MRAFAARAEFRRLHRDAPWVLSGVWIDRGFHPVRPGVDRMRTRLLGWGLASTSELPRVLAPDDVAAAAVALAMARQGWPETVQDDVPHDFAWGEVTIMLPPSAFGPPAPTRPILVSEP